MADAGMAIVFLGLSAANGKHRCRPATKEEMMAPETDEFKQLCNSGVTRANVNQALASQDARDSNHRFLAVVKADGHA